MPGTGVQSVPGSNLSIISSVQEVTDNMLWGSPLRSMTYGDSLNWGVNMFTGEQNTINSKYVNVYKDNTSQVLVPGSGEEPIYLPTQLDSFKLSAYYPFTEDGDDGVLMIYDTSSVWHDYLYVSNQFKKSYLVEGVTYTVNFNFKHLASKVAIFVDTTKTAETILSDSLIIYSGAFPHPVSYDMASDSFIVARHEDGTLKDSVPIVLRKMDDLTIEWSSHSKQSGKIFVSDLLVPNNIAEINFDIKIKTPDGDTLTYVASIPDIIGANSGQGKLKSNTIKVYNYVLNGTGVTIEPTFPPIDPDTWNKDWDVWDIEEAEGIYIRRTGL
jgi:hypothetical protein